MGIEYVSHYGDDLAVVNAARVSLGKVSTAFNNADIGLIKYLAKHEHFSPFRHCHVTVRVKCPIAVERQWTKHRYGCITGDTLITFLNCKNETGRKYKIPIQKLYEQWISGRPHQPTIGDVHYTQQRIKNRRVRCLDESTGKFKVNYIEDILYQGVKPTYKITTETGYQITCTDDHRFWTETGWKELKDCVNSLDSFKLSFNKVGVNGKVVAGNGKYRDKQYLEDCYTKGMTVDQIAKDCGNVSQEVVKKWAYTFKVPFNKRDARFKPGAAVWNTGKRYKLANGYKRSLTHKQVKGSAHHWWRGGASTERSLIGIWTRTRAAACHKKYNYICQECAQGSSGLVAHHIIPVSQDESLARDPANLITVCAPCHYQIHRNSDTEHTFAKKIYERNGQAAPKEFLPNNKYTTDKKLRVVFEHIVKVESMGNQPTYDLSMRDTTFPNFVGNGFVLHNCEINSISGRYVTFEEDYHAPKVLRKGSPSIKQGSLLEAVDDHEQAIKIYKRMMDMAFTEYRALLKLGVCKEQARMVLPLALNTEFICTFSLQAAAHFYKLRSDSHAQAEIREYAEELDKIISPLFPEAWKALKENM